MALLYLGVFFNSLPYMPTLQYPIIREKYVKRLTQETKQLCDPSLPLVHKLLCWALLFVAFQDLA